MQKRDRWLFYISLVVMAFFAFFVLGSREPVLFADSGAYMKVERTEGVMPVYPLFLLVNQYLFGMDRYLEAVIVEQSILAAVCVILFTKVIKDEFHLHIWEGYIVFFLSLLPFTTEMPQSMATQQILTEGLSYALYYLFIITLLKSVWSKKFRWFAGSLAMAVLLAMVRSQLQILFCVCGVIFLYMVCRQEKIRISLFARVATGIVGCLAICFAGIFVISRITVVYQDAIKGDGIFYEIVMKVQFPAMYEEYVLGQSEEVVEDGREVEEQPSMEELATWRWGRTSQYVTLIFSRGMYEADREDMYLFDDEAVRSLYAELYEAVDAEKQRYAYAQKGLWMWQDIMGGVGQIGKTCFWILPAYYAENHPDIVLSDHYSETRNAHLASIGITLLKAHFGRFLYHTLMMLPQAFICTVFFQIKPIYLLCHLVTLFLYLSALALMAREFADKETDDKRPEFMALVLGSNVVMVVVISLVFFGQQRYLVYNFGAFYIAYYLLLRELWNSRICDKIKKRFTNKKKMD